MTKPRKPAWVPADYTVPVVEAFKALSEGKASEGQQGLVLQWIIEIAAETYEQSYRSDGDGGDRETAFAEGRRYVGLSVVKMVNMPGKLLNELRKKNG